MQLTDNFPIAVLNLYHNGTKGSVESFYSTIASSELQGAAYLDPDDSDTIMEHGSLVKHQIEGLIPDDATELTIYAKDLINKNLGTNKNVRIRIEFYSKN